MAVWKDGRPVLEWCPAVTRHLATRTARGDITARRVTLAVGEITATVPVADVADGAVWVDRFPVAGVGTRAVREVLRNIVDDQAARLSLVEDTPRWAAGRLVLPPQDVMMRGYGEVSGTADEWRELLREIGRSPRMALAVGMAVGGLYVSPLGRQSYTCHLPGASSEGKTTTMNASAAVFGSPDLVVENWSVTKNAPGAWLRKLATLTGWRDELGAAGFTPAVLESAVFTMMQGAERSMSDRRGQYREPTGGWHGCLMSSGNESILGQIANEGIAARVVEIASPLTLDAEHAERVDGLASRVYGHGLAAIVERGPTPEAFAEVVSDHLSAIGCPAGGVPRRIGGHIALGVAGAVVLGDLAGCGEFTAGVVEAGRLVLAEMVEGLAQRGARPGDRLLSAIRGAMAARPGEFPTRQQYADALRQEFRLPPSVVGWDLTGEPYPGDVAIIDTEMKPLAQAAGIADVMIALRDLRARDMLLAPTSGRHLAKKIRIPGQTKQPRAYVITGVVEADQDAAPAASTPDAPAPVEDTSTPAPAMVECKGCGTPIHPAGDNGSGYHGTCDPAAGWGPGTIGAEIHERAREDASPAPAPVEATSTPAPAPVEPGPAPRTSPVSRTQSRTAARPAAAVLAMAADSEGIYLSGGQVLDPGAALDSMPEFLALIAGRMPGGGSVAITAEVAARLGFPGKPVSRLRGKELTAAKDCRAVAEARAAGWESTRNGLGAWSSWYGEDRPDVSVLVIEWVKSDAKSTESSQLVKSGDSAPVALHKLTQFRSLVGVPFTMSPGTTCTNLIKTVREAMPKARRPLWKWQGADLPMGTRQGQIVWHRPLTDAEKAMPYVIGVDGCKAYLAAMENAELAVKPLEHEGIAGGFDKTRAGYWRISGEWRPFPLLLDLTEGRDWLPTPIVTLLTRTGMPEEMITDAWLAPGLTAHSLRIGREPAQRIRDALATFPADVTGADGQVRDAVKMLYSQGVGMLATERTFVQRRDWSDTILGTAKLAFLSKVIRIGQTTGRWPVAIDTDCAYYAAASPDDNPGFPIGEGLGQFRIKPKDVRTMADYLAEKEGEK